MTVTVKRNMPPIVPTVIRRKAGLKSGDRVQFRVSCGVISIVPIIPVGDPEDSVKVRDPAMRRQIKQGNADICAGRPGRRQSC